MIELDHLKVQLSGQNLIEASAGTGKTYAVACLYLRLLIEKGLTPEQILVVTYTVAATEELRVRIRSRIRGALEVFSGLETKDEFLKGLRDNINGSGPGVDVSVARLEQALKSFDLASIFTIHGFCLRALQDNAFESGSLYDTDLVTDQSELLLEVVDDFWRTKFFGESAPLLGYALHHKCRPDDLSSLLKGMLGNPKMEIQPSYDSAGIRSLEEGCGRGFLDVQMGWKKHRKDVIALLESDKGLSRSQDYYRLDLLPPLYRQMDALTSGDNPFDLFSGFEKFSTSGVKEGTKKKGTPPSHPFFDLCEELQSSVRERFLALKWELIAFAKERLRVRKRELNIRFFDDLLSDLYDALNGSLGAALAQNLRGKYRGALIDEFQDTDPVQYEIFRKIYTEPDCPLFLIGDPKQAIYSFRGADVFAYLEAAASVGEGRRFTLTNNWRSAPRLLDSFNTIFDNKAKPFVFDEIASHSIKSGRPKDTADPFVFPGGNESPLQVWMLPADPDGKPISVGGANVVIPRATAAEIARLLQEGKDGNARIEGRPVVPGDIAVIVRSHRQAISIQRALVVLNIPSVMRSDESIFETPEAHDICILIAALADPGSESKIRAALVTEILGRSGDDIARLLEDEGAWEQCLNQFRGYHQVWLERGFMAMSQALLAGEGVRGRLLRRPDGERRLTNVLHCFEVIHGAAHRGRFGMEAAVQWFGERVTTPDSAEEYQIRLETDEKAVKIVTIHLSKGLEYPIVFCPFHWGGVRKPVGVLTFHDRFRMVKDFGSPDFESHGALAQKEELAENLRLLYVALTRAKFRCYLVAGRLSGRSWQNRPETSALSYLFHSSASTKKSTDLVNAMEAEGKTLTSRNVEDQLTVLADRSRGSIAVLKMPEVPIAAPYVPADGDGAPPECRKFQGTIDRTWRVSSFSSLAVREAAADELPDRDESGGRGESSAPAEPVEKPQGMSIFTFPRGAHAGIFLHEIFEKLDFASGSRDDAGRIVAKCLDKHGFSVEWQPHIRAMVDSVLGAPLTVPAAGSFALDDLKPGSWVTEMEFFFPLKFITSDALKTCLRHWNRRCQEVDLLQICASLNFKPVRGMVRGFMDMVFEQGGKFYLLDWKSNHLGNHARDYGRDALKEEMERNLYPFQYLLYTVALDRYLSLRSAGYRYTTHFGGVLYLFLRGIDPAHESDSGIFRDLPPEEMIRDLSDRLVEAGG